MSYLDDDIIVIETVKESVTREDMSAREKKIFDYAYRKGVEIGEKRWWYFPFGIACALISGCVLILKSCTT